MQRSKNIVLDANQSDSVTSSTIEHSKRDAPARGEILHPVAVSKAQEAAKPCSNYRELTQLDRNASVHLGRRTQLSGVSLRFGSTGAAGIDIGKVRQEKDLC